MSIALRLRGITKEMYLGSVVRKRCFILGVGPCKNFTSGGGATKGMFNLGGRALQEMFYYKGGGSLQCSPLGGGTM